MSRRARLHYVLDGGTFKEPQQGTPADITAAELATVGLRGGDSKRPQGPRKVPDAERSSGETAPLGRALTSSVVMPESATFEQPNDSVAYVNDFQVEVFYPPAEGGLVDFYGMWRSMKLGILVDSGSDLFIDQTIGGMIDRDNKTSVLCEAT